ncbi:hypothetical protein ELQ92_03670 [Labedella populi]|uniref:LppX_LprAFG lipoprotein n=1 Tax=Labedella populi TaxID=2498850 RepID=A0A444QFL8_9MICO|nr:hypothetical protein [Labedella populi]RWZ68329.1 hypothetical protein ELQ92_03670 [Labedella populi]
MNERSTTTVAAVALAAVLGLTGCASAGAEPTPLPTPTVVDLSEVDVTDVDRNGVEYLSDRAALDAVLAGMDEAGPVTVTGSFQERPDEDGGGTRRVRIDLTGTQSRFRAEISAADATMTAVVTDGRAYVTGNAAFAEVLGVPEAAGGVVCLPSDDPRITTWAPSLSPSDLLESMVGEEAGVSLEPAVGPEDVTESVEFVIGAAGAPIGSLVVAATGPAVPLRLVAADTRGDADFSFVWGETDEVVVPEEAALPCA